MHAGTLLAGAYMPPRRAPAGPPPANELQRAHSPLRRSDFERELVHHPNKAFVTWLLDAINNGVSIGYTGPRTPHTAPNLTSARLQPWVIDNELQKEIDAGRILGPYTDRPFPNLRCSGVGVVPKKDGRWQVIMHLSAPPGSSINDHISPEDYSLHYSSVDDAVQLLTALGRGALMAKVDLKSAFRMIPVRHQDWELLGIHWRDNFYVDTCLPFGCRSSPYLFNQFAEAIQWILAHNYQANLIHYLDDFFLVGPPSSAKCAQSVEDMLRLCSTLGIPVAMGKLEGPATTITYLGIEIDSQRKELRLPLAKQEELLQELETWLGRQKTTKRRLLSLIGKLSFAAKVVPAGRLFLRRLIDLSTTVSRLHHYITLNTQARADIQWWCQFLPSWNGRAMFLDTAWVSATDIQLYTDASGSKGFGAYFAGDWLRGDWQPTQCLPHRSIQWQELFAIFAAATTWAPRLCGKRLRFFCDNEAIVNAWQRKSAKHPQLADLLRRLFLCAAKHNFTLALTHIPGRENGIADALSRNQMTRFFSLAPQANRHPTPVPDELTQL